MIVTSSTLLYGVILQPYDPIYEFININSSTTVQTTYTFAGEAPSAFMMKPYDAIYLYKLNVTMKPYDAMNVLKKRSDNQNYESWTK